MGIPADEDTAGIRRAWGWLDHLSAGGTTPWARWTAEAPSRGRVLPGAQQLELLRRANLVRPCPPGLAARVLEASAPGRGRPDLELEGSIPTPRFGPRPVDPGALPEDELLRVAAALLAEDLVTAGLPPREPPARPRPWRRRYRLAGDPFLAAPLRRELVARGRPPGGRGGPVLVLGTDLGRMLADVWSTRCLTEGGAPWRRWVDGLVRRDELPPRADLLAIARARASRRGAAQVHVVLDRTALPGLVGVRRLGPGPAPLPADGADLARRVAAVLGLLVPPPRRAALLGDTLRPLLEAEPGPALVVPPAHLEWVRERAVRMRDGLLRAGYAVHGDPDSLLPDERPGVEAPSDAGVLDRAVRLLLAGARPDDDQPTGDYQEGPVR